MRSIVWGLAIVATLGACRPAAANLIVNGSFEAGDFRGFAAQAGAAFVAPAGFSGYAPTDGDAFAALGYVGGLGSLSQTFATAAGRTYELRFDLASDGLGPNAFRAEINGAALFDQVDLPAQAFTRHAFLFTATGPSATVTFAARDDLSYLALDNVAVDLANPVHLAAVPEPATLISCGTAGVVGLLGTRRRRAAGA